MEKDDEWTTVSTIPHRFISEFTFDHPTPSLTAIKLQKHPWSQVEEWRILLYNGNHIRQVVPVWADPKQKNLNDSKGFILSMHQRSALIEEPDAYMPFQDALKILKDIYGIHENWG